MKIRVTPKDILKGRRNIGDSCPIALAIKRRVYYSVHVGRTQLTFYNKKECKSYDLPPKAIKFINEFDKHKKVKPLTFNINIP